MSNCFIEEDEKKNILTFFFFFHFSSIFHKRFVVRCRGLNKLVTSLISFGFYVSYRTSCQIRVREYLATPCQVSAVQIKKKKKRKVETIPTQRSRYVLQKQIDEN